jgi:ABC-type phosphate transport system permease subunit
MKEYLLITLFVYLIVGVFYLLMTTFMIFKSKNSVKHKQSLLKKWKTLRDMPNFGKGLLVVTVLISIIWLIVGWPEGVYTGFKRLKKTKDEI